MQTITTIGFDIAKSVFQVHGVDAAGEVVIRQKRTSRLSALRPAPAVRSMPLVSEAKPGKGECDAAEKCHWKECRSSVPGIESS
jgi:hypothetical protein